MNAQQAQQKCRDEIAARGYTLLPIPDADASDTSVCACSKEHQGPSTCGHPRCEATAVLRNDGWHFFPVIEA